MPRTLCSALALCLLAAPVSADTFLVTNFNASGDGSLQAALDAAGATEEMSTIFITQAEGWIEAPNGLRYEGRGSLRIFGNDVTISTTRNETVLSVIGPEYLNLSHVQLLGGGGYSMEARDADAPAGAGLFFDVADDTIGRALLELQAVTVRDVPGHGIHVSDCMPVETCDTGAGAEDAGIEVRLSDIVITEVGQGSHDADGIRVDERGRGDITLMGQQVAVYGVGGDGIELDEDQDGDVVVDLIRAYFTENGSYCDPAVLEAFLPDTMEGEFDQGQMAVADLPQLGAGVPDPACIELDLDTYDDGSVEAFEYAIDVDDGLDLDEGGPGDIVASFTAGEMLGNFDEGYDFDEAGPGDIDVVFTGIIGNGNIDDAIKLSEEGPGNVYMTATAVETSSNGGVGIVAEEADAGDLIMVIVGGSTAGNDGGELGIEAVQEDAGVGNVYVIDTEIADGIETDGVTLDAD